MNDPETNQCQSPGCGRLAQQGGFCPVHARTKAWELRRSATDPDVVARLSGALQDAMRPKPRPLSRKRP